MQTTSLFHHHADNVVVAELDLRELPAPEPMQRALQTADALRTRTRDSDVPPT